MGQAEIRHPGLFLFAGREPKGVLIDGIIGNLSGLFDTVNTKVGEIAADVGATPQGWNSGIFNMIRNLSESVIIPIAGAILAFVMTYELIQMVTEKNNLHDRVFCEGGFSNTSNINDGQLICGRMKPTHTEGGTPLLYMNKRL